MALSNRRFPMKHQGHTTSDQISTRIGDTIGDMSSSGDTAATFCATLVDEWARQGVRHAVVAPGSRSTPLALALARHDAFEVHVFHDERSASFAALGIGSASGVPAVLLCSSGTAGTHFHGAVVEAHQSGVPMIVCTADRPPELRDVAAAQTIDQTNLFGTAVRWFHDPGVPSRDAAMTWRSLAARAVQSALGIHPGPVHLNLPFREPLTGDVVDMPHSREKKWSDVIHLGTSETQDVSEIVHAINGRKGIIVAGRGASREVVRQFLQHQAPCTQRGSFWSKWCNPSCNQVGIDEHGTCSFAREKFTRERSFSCPIGAGNDDSAWRFFHVKHSNF